MDHVTRPSTLLGGEPTPEVQDASLDGYLDAYEEFTGEVTPALQAKRAQLIDGILAIVAVEGPLLGDRLRCAYVNAYGGSQVSKQIARIVNSAIASAVRRGLLVEGDPLSEAGIKPRTYRLAHQPEARARRLGVRTFAQVPPRELAALLARVAEQQGTDDIDALYHQALTLLGLKTLTPDMRHRLDAVRSLIS